MKKNSNIDMAIAENKKMCVFTYWKKQEAQSKLFTLLDRLAELNEEQLNHKNLYDLIARVCEYLKALNLYNYYCSEYRKALLDNGSIKVGE